MKKETAIYPSHRKLLGTTLAAAIMAALSCLLVIVQPHGTFGLVIGIAGLIFFGGGFCILFIMLLKNFFRSKPTLLLTPDSLRIYAPAKGIYLTIEWQRIADFSVFRTYGQKFIRIELHDPDRAIDEEKNRIAKELMRWQMKYFGSPYAITASTVDIGTTELEKILREYLQASREKSVVNCPPLPQKRFSEPIPHIVGNTLAPSVNESDQDMRRSMAGIYRLQTDFPNVIIHFHIHLFGSTVAQTPSEKRIQGQNYERGHQPRKAIVGQGAD